MVLVLPVLGVKVQTVQSLEVVRALPVNETVLAVKAKGVKVLGAQVVCVNV